MKNSKERKILALILISLLVILVSSQSQQTDQTTGIQSSQHDQSKLNMRLSRSQQIKLEQKERFKKVQERVEPRTKFSNFLFTVQGVQEFILNIPVAQQVALNLFTYDMVNNAYMRPQNVQNQTPIKIFVYENNNRLIHQSNFYFQNYILLEGQQLSTYTIRFINPGMEKLIAMSLKKVTETAHFEKVIDNTVIQNHATKAGQLLQQLKFLTNAFQRYTFINFQAVKAILYNLSLYFYWNIVEMIMGIVVCLIQITFIRKICQAESVV